MQFALLVVLLATAVALCVPALAVSASLWRAAWRRGSVGTVPPPEEARLLFLVPAHNEEGLIGACVKSLVEMDFPADRRRIVVIADNCIDQTPTRTRAAGGECLERHDPALPGKPRAIAWVLQQIPLDPWDGVVIVDADTIVDPGFARNLATCGPLRGRAVQGYIGMPNENESWLTRLSAVLARARYEVLYTLKEAAGVNCPMTGNGMCVGADLLRERGWTAFSLTENWELYAEYTAAGAPIRLARNALLFAQEARSLGESATQRRRWMAGRLWVFRHWFGRIVTSPRIDWLQKLDTLGELGGPSPVLHLVLACIVAAGAFAVGGVGRTVLLLLLLAAFSLAPLVVATVIVVARHPRRADTIKAFLLLPAYAGWRVLVAVATLVTLRDVRWRKTEHHQQAE